MIGKHHPNIMTIECLRSKQSKLETVIRKLLMGNSTTNQKQVTENQKRKIKNHCAEQMLVERDTIHYLKFERSYIEYKVSYRLNCFNEMIANSKKILLCIKSWWNKVINLHILEVDISVLDIVSSFWVKRHFTLCPVPFSINITF